MACNFPYLRRSKLWYRLGARRDEQIRQTESSPAAAPHARWAAAIARHGPGGGRTQGRGIAHHGERVERAARSRRAGGVETTSSRAAVRARCPAEGRAGQTAQGWRARAGICHGAVDTATSGAADRGEVRPSVQREPSVADSGELGVLQPAARQPRARAGRGGDPALEEATVACAKKNARKQGRIIVFIDESGLSERPTRVRGWAP